MNLVHLIILLLSSSLCSSEITISPSLEEIHLQADDELELTCTSTDGDDIDFFYPKSIDNEIESSHVEIVRDATFNLTKFTLRRRKTYYGDTGWYGCTEASKNHRNLFHVQKPITPYNYNEILIKWVYIYVTSPYTPWITYETNSIVYSSVGDNGIIPCRPNFPTANVTLSFQDSVEVIPLDDRLSFDPKVGFTLHNILDDDSGTYICNVENFHHEDQNDDDVMTIDLKVTAPSAYSQVIINSDSLRQMSLGQDFSMNCSVYNNLDSYFSPSLIRWVTPRGSKQITTTLSSALESEYFSELTIKNVTADDVGEYTCYFYGLGIETAKINLQLHNESYIILSSYEFRNDYQVIVGDHRVEIGANIEWTVVVEAYPIPKLQWFDPKGNEIKNDCKFYNFQVNGERFLVTLVKSSVTYEDRGTYTLTATNIAESREIKLTFDVSVEPTILQKSEDAEVISASYNQTVSGECKAHGNPIPIIIWKYSHNFKNSTENTAKGDLFNITSNTVGGKKVKSTINVKAQNTGKLICIACNEVNCSSSVIKVINVPVLMKLRENKTTKSDYKVVSLSEGETLTIYCLGNKDIYFFYPYLGQRIVNSNLSLTLDKDGSKNAWLVRKNIVYADSGWYGCVYTPKKYQHYTNFPFPFTPDICKLPASQWVYVFVESSDNFFVDTPYIKKDVDDNFILEVNIGNNLIFPCRPTSLEYQVDLYSDEEKLKLDERLLYDPMIGFTMLKVTNDIPYFFYCIINDTNTGNFQRRDFSVYLENSTAGLDSPKISTEKLTQMVVGKSYTLQCIAFFNRVKTNYYFKWNTPQQSYRITQKLYKIYNATDKMLIENWEPQAGFILFELTIENVMPEDFGEYECIIYEYSSFKRENVFLLPHTRKHLDILNMYNGVSINVGNHFNYSIYISAYPLPTFKWYDSLGRERKQEFIINKYRINGEAFEAILEFKIVNSSDAGTHKIFIDNSEMNKTITFDLLVIVKPEIQKPKYKHIGNYRLNQKIEFKCQAKGLPRPNFKWWYNKHTYNASESSTNSELFENEETKKIGKSIAISTVTIKMIESGWVKCSACNTEGCHENIIQMINVYDPDIECPKLDTQVATCGNVITGRFLEPIQSKVYDLITTSQQVNASKGSFVRIQCGFSADKFRNKILWRKSNATLSTYDRVVINNNKNDIKPRLYESELTIKNVDKSDQGYYICEGMTKDGSTVQNEYKLHINASTALMASIIIQLSMILLSYLL